MESEDDPGPREHRILNQCLYSFLESSKEEYQLSNGYENLKELIQNTIYSAMLHGLMIIDKPISKSVKNYINKTWPKSLTKKLKKHYKKDENLSSKLKKELNKFTKEFYRKYLIN